jgi:hypothetical protein
VKSISSGHLPLIPELLDTWKPPVSFLVKSFSSGHLPLIPELLDTWKPPVSTLYGLNAQKLMEISLADGSSNFG